MLFTKYFSVIIIHHYAIHFIPQVEFNSYYRPQTKFAKVMFLHLSVSHSVHRAWIADPPPREQTPPPGADTPPQEQTTSPPLPPGADPPGADTPRNRHPQEQAPPRCRHPPGADTPPHQEQCMLGDTANKRWYASFGNEFLFDTHFPSVHFGAYYILHIPRPILLDPHKNYLMAC